MSCLQAALRYKKMGFSIIPILPPQKDEHAKDKGKKPPISWLPYQNQRPTDDQIQKWFKNQDSRLAIITGHLSNLTVIDCDTPEAIEQIESILPDNFHIPIAISPRGGRHYYFRHCPEIPNKAGIGRGIDSRSEGGYIIAPPSAGINGTGYSWLDGCGIDQVEPPELVGMLKASLLSYISTYSLYRGEDTENVNVLNSPQTSSNVLMFEEGRRDDDLFHTANCLVKGRMPDLEIKQVLEKLIISWGEAPDQKWIDAKVESALKRSESKNQNIAEDVRDFVMSSSGLLVSSNIFTCLHLSSRPEKKAAHCELARLVDKGIIEKTGRFAGEYRIVNRDYDVLDANKIESGKPLDIRLPFYLDHYVEILPGDLIVLAGTPNAGKTAIFLDTVAHNMAVWECWYFSTELGPTAWARRRDKREPAVDWNFKFVHGFSNYEDIIKPDAMNFIDYVEQNEGEAYKIPGILAKIQRKLKKGVAFVALQKNIGADYGVGGQQTKAKPALFLTVEANYPRGARMRVVKAKAFKEYNPNGFYCDFKIIKGINLLETSGWGPEL